MVGVALLACQYASAEEQIPSESLKNTLICAAVFPCALDGSVLPHYEVGACASVYQKQCAVIKVKEVSEAANVCETENANLSKQVKQLKRQLRKSKRSHQR